MVRCECYYSANTIMLVPVLLDWYYGRLVRALVLVLLVLVLLVWLSRTKNRRIAASLQLRSSGPGLLAAGELVRSMGVKKRDLDSTKCAIFDYTYDATVIQGVDSLH